MKKYLLACTLLLLSALPAFAQASYVVKDGNGVLQTIRSVNCSSNICPASVPIDINGAPFGVTSNPFFMAFGTGATLPAFAATPTVNIGNINGAVPSLSNPLFVTPATGASFNVVCTSGCAGGGGGGLSVPYGGPIGANGTPGGFKDGSGNLQPILGDVTNGQWVSVRASTTIPVTGTFFQATQPVSAASLPLPTGAATSGNQTTANASLTSIDGKTPALGQALAASSVPIVLTAAQLSTLTPLSTVTVTQATAANLNVLATQTGVWQNRILGNAGAVMDFPGQNSNTAGNALQVGGQFNTTPTTIVSGNSSPLQLDANGNLLVNVKVGGGTGGTSSTFAAAFPATGTAAGMSQGGNMVALTGTAGNLNVQCSNCSGSGVSTADKASFVAGTSLFAGGGGFFQTTATTNPLTTGQQGLFQVTAQRALFSNLRDSSGNELGVAAAPVQVSLANTAANGTALLVTGTGGTFPVSQATAASLNATVVGTGTFAVQSTPTSAAAWGVNTLGSTTAGQSGQLALGAVTTAAPTYTTAQTNALSLTTAGLLRVDGSGVTQPVSLASTTITGTVAVTQSGAWSLSANQSVNVAQINGVTPLMGNGVTGTGSQRVTIASDNTAFAVNATVTQATSSNLKAQVDPLTPASWGIATATQNSASATNGELVLGQFNTSPTTITSGNMSPFQLDASANLLVNCKSGCSGAADTTAALSGMTVNGAATQIALVGTNSVAVLLSGTWTATLTPEVSADGGTTWVASQFYNVNTHAASATVSANGTYDIVGTGGKSHARVRISAFTSGTVTGNLKATSQAPSANDAEIAINTTAGSSIVAGANIIGKVGIDQTTPGTTNAVFTTNWPTTVDTNSGNKSASTPRIVIATDQPNLTTPLNVALAANQSVNVAQIAGVATPVGSGLQATAPRMTLATDSPGIVTLGQTTKSASVPMAIASDQVGVAGTANATVFTVQGIASMTKLLVTPDSVALPANQSVNVSQVNGVTTLTGTGAVGTGSQRIAVGTDTATIAGSAPGTAGTASSNVLTVQGIASMTAINENQTQVNGVAISTGTGAVGTGTQRIAVGTDTATIAGSAPGTAGTPSANVVTVQGAASMTPILVNPSNGYPNGAIAETASTTGTTAATTATLATAVGKTTYICGFSIRANATAAATANSTITGTITGTLNFTQWTAPLASGIGLTEERFTPCIPASTTNTSIAVVSAAPGAGGVVSVSAWGFQL